VFRRVAGVYAFQEPAGLLHERTDAALHRLHDAKPTGGDGSSLGRPALPFSLSMQLPIAELGDAAIGF
jgi:hypothetical protein